MKILTKSGHVVINGRQYTGRSISITGNTVMVDGVEQDGSLPLPAVVHVTVHGDCQSVENHSGDIVVSGDVGSIRAGSGDIRCGNVGGNVATGSGDVFCGKVSGRVMTGSGDITHSIGGLEEDESDAPCP